MSELPPGHIEIRKGHQVHRLWITTAVYAVLRIYARQNKITTIDAGNRILLGFLSEHYGIESPSELSRRTLEAMFPTGKVIIDTILALSKGKRPHRRPVPLHEDGKTPYFLTKPGSTGQNNP